MAKTRLTPVETVSSLVSKLDKPIRETVEYLRKLILATDKEIGEQVKWNSPSFYYTGEMKPFDPKEYKRHIVVMNLNRGRILLVFPTGAIIEDHSGLLEGDYADGRKMIRFKDLNDVKLKEKQLISIIKNWLSKIEK